MRQSLVRCPLAHVQQVFAGKDFEAKDEGLLVSLRNPIQRRVHNDFSVAGICMQNTVWRNHNIRNVEASLAFSNDTHNLLWAASDHMKEKDRPSCLSEGSGKMYILKGRFVYIHLKRW